MPGPSSPYAGSSVTVVRASGSHDSKSGLLSSRKLERFIPIVKWRPAVGFHVLHPRIWGCGPTVGRAPDGVLQALLCDP
jgi:hypothetical protein